MVKRYQYTFEVVRGARKDGEFQIGGSRGNKVRLIETVSMRSDLAWIPGIGVYVVEPRPKVSCKPQHTLYEAGNVLGIRVGKDIGWLKPVSIHETGLVQLVWPGSAVRPIAALSLELNAEESMFRPGDVVDLVSKDAVENPKVVQIVAQYGYNTNGFLTRVATHVILDRSIEVIQDSRSKKQSKKEKALLSNDEEPEETDEQGEENNG